MVRGKGNSLNGVCSTQASCPLRIQAPLPIGKADFEKMVLSAPKASSFSAGDLVGRYGWIETQMIDDR